MNESSKSPLWSMLAWFLLIIGGLMCLYGLIWAGQYGEWGLFVFGIISLGLGFASMYHLKHAKTFISSDRYEQYLNIALYMAMSKKSTQYLSEFQNETDYFALKELFDWLPVLYNNYGSEVLTTPLRLTKPISPYQAGYIATMLGGVAVGVAAMLEAIEKEEKYKQNVKDVIAATISVGNAYDKVHNCYLGIISIIKTKTLTWNDWQSEREAIENELKQKYSVY